jgi:membrane associated rhomboid family serine protease
MLPLWDTQPHRKTPFMTALLIVACLGAFGHEIALGLANEAALETWITRHGFVPTRFFAGWTDPVQWQTVATSMFLHGGVAHVLGNCWFLWVFGNNVEDRLGSFGFLLFYAVTGAFAALTQALADWNSAVPLIGASGAISGVLGAYLVFFPRAWVVSLVPWIVPILPIPAVVFLLLWFAVQAYAGVGSFLDGAAGAGGVAWWAHAGGFVAGACLAFMLPRRRRR